MPRKSVARPRTESLYSVHPGVLMTQKWVADLRQKTGRTLEQWVRLVKEWGPATEKGRRSWLQDRHRLGTNTAWWIAERAEGKGLESSDPEAYLNAAEEYVEAMFAGKKAALRCQWRRKGGPFWRLKRGQRRGCAVDSLASTAG